MGDQLESYIKDSLVAGLTKDQIQSNLVASGWDEATVRAAIKPSISTSKKIAFVISMLIFLSLGILVAYGQFKKTQKPVTNFDKRAKVTKLNESWQRIEIENRFSIEIPVYLTSYDGYTCCSHLYFAQKDGYQNLRSVRISFDGVHSKSVTEIAEQLNVVRKEPLMSRTQKINNAEAVIFEAVTDRQGGSYQTVLKGPTGLVYVLDFGSQTLQQDKDLMDKILNSFLFVEESVSGGQTHNLSGTVSLITGNCMPGASSNCSKKKTQATLLLFPPQRTFGAGNMEPSQDEKNPLYTIETDEEGAYSQQVARGTYTAIVVDEKGEYVCGHWTGTGIACQVDVLDDDVRYSPSIDRAAY